MSRAGNVQYGFECLWFSMTLLTGHVAAAAPPRTARVRALPRRALPTEGRGCVALRAAALLPPTGASAGRRCSTSWRSPGPIQQLTVAGVRVHFPGHSTAPRASAAAGSPGAANFSGDGGTVNFSSDSGGGDNERGEAAAPSPSPLDDHDDGCSKKGRATQGATRAGPSLITALKSTSAVFLAFCP